MFKFEFEHHCIHITSASLSTLMERGSKYGVVEGTVSFYPISTAHTYRLAVLECFSETNSRFPDSLCHVLWPGGRQLSIRALASAGHQTAGQREWKREKEPSEENPSSLYGIISLHAGHIIELLPLPLHIFPCKPVGCWNDKDHPHMVRVCESDC